MTVIDMETRELTDRAPVFSERVMDDFVRYCNDNGIAVAICLIEADKQFLWTGMHSYSEDMLGLMEVCQSRISRGLDSDDEVESEDEDSSA